MAFTSSPRARACVITSPAATPLQDDAERACPRPRTPATRPAARERLEAGPEPRRDRVASAPATPAPELRAAPPARRRRRAGCRRRCCRGCPAERCRPTSSVASSAPIGKPPPSALARRHEVGRDAVPLVRPHPPGPAHPGLDLVEAEQRARAAASARAPPRGSPSGAGITPASPWMGSTMNAAVRRSEGAASSAARSPYGTCRTPGTSGSKPCWYFACPPAGDGEQRPAVERVLAGDDLVALRVAAVGVELPGELQHRLVRLRAAVAEEGARAPTGSSARSASASSTCARDVEVVRDVPERARLLLEGAHQRRVAVAERVRRRRRRGSRGTRFPSASHTRAPSPRTSATGCCR